MNISSFLQFDKVRLTNPGKIPAIFRCQQTDHKNEHRRNHHCRKFSKLPIQENTAYNRDEEGESGNRDWHRAVCGYVGVDSIIGPLYLMAGRTMDEGWGVYFFWGRKM